MQYEFTDRPFSSEEDEGPIIMEEEEFPNSNLETDRIQDETGDLGSVGDFSDDDGEEAEEEESYDDYEEYEDDEPSNNRPQKAPFVPRHRKGEVGTERLPKMRGKLRTRKNNRYTGHDDRSRIFINRIRSILKKSTALSFLVLILYSGYQYKFGNGFADTQKSRTRTRIPKSYAIGNKENQLYPVRRNPHRTKSVSINSASDFKIRQIASDLAYHLFDQNVHCICAHHLTGLSKYPKLCAVSDEYSIENNAFIVMNPEIIGSTHTKNKAMLGRNCRDSKVTPDSTTKCYIQSTVSCTKSKPIPVLRSNWIQLKFNPLESVEESYWMTLTDNSAACIQLAIEEMNGEALC